MDYLESLGQKLSEVTMYDVKSAIASAKAVAMNWTEYEQKVREATNDDAWGASTTLMNEIAQGTHNFQHFNEIMPTIYKRFTEKEARQWRQIYKSLQLLEYLVKHGSERVVDDARSHISMIKILRNFHYVDEKGKDQGINVRNRSKELAELLSDLDRVRTERRKAKANKNKYGGISNEDVSFRTAGGSRYGGFGSEQLAGRSSGYEGSGSSSRGGFQDSSAPEHDEYDAGDDDDRAGSSARRSSGPSGRRPSVTASPAKAPPPPKKEVNLFDFDDDDQVPAPVAAAPSSFASPPVTSAAADDDFDDFVAAPSQSSAAPVARAQPVPSFPAPAIGGAAKSTFFDMMSAAPSVPVAQSPPSYISRPGGAMSPPISVGPLAPTSNAALAVRPMASTANSFSSVNTTKPAASGDAFGDLFSMAGGSSSATLGAKKSPGPSMAAMSNQPSATGIWATPSSGFGGAAATSKPAATMNGGARSINGGFGSGGDDDLLL